MQSIASVVSAVSPSRYCSDSLARAQRHVFGGVCHGTLGELIQGPLQHKGKMCISLISLPVRRYSYVYFRSGVPHLDFGDLTNKTKCRTAIDLYLSMHGRRMPDGVWLYDSELLEGKGMASSTADIVATIRCLDAVFADVTPLSSILKILRQIERSDSVFLNRYSLYLSGEQTLVTTFATSPSFFACYIDEGDRIDTESVSETLFSHYRRYRHAYEQNLEQCICAFNALNVPAIAHCATRSAILNQEAIPKLHLDRLRRHQKDHKADGIFVAHTGSLIGYLYLRTPPPALLGELSAFFLSLGYGCRFAQTGV